MALENKTVLLAGLNTDLEMDISRLLMDEGVKQLIFASRSKDRGQQTLRKIQSSKRVSVLNGLDLLNPRSIEEAIRVLPQGLKIDALFLQAAEDEDGKQLVEWEGKKIERSVFQNTVGVRLIFQALMERDLLASNARIIVVAGQGNKGLPSHIEKPEYHSIEELQDYIGGRTGAVKSAVPLVFLNFSLPFGFWKWQPKRVTRNLFGLKSAA